MYSLSYRTSDIVLTEVMFYPFISLFVSRIHEKVKGYFHEIYGIRRLWTAEIRRGKEKKKKKEEETTGQNIMVCPIP